MTIEEKREIATLFARMRFMLGDMKPPTIENVHWAPEDDIKGWTAFSISGFGPLSPISVSDDGVVKLDERDF